MSASEDVQDREARAATNQSLFREVNEHVKGLEATFSAAAPVDVTQWICECANDTCLERIAMSMNAYEAIREDGARFFVAPTQEHVWPDLERVTEQHDQYWIVEKIAVAEKVAEHLDPRSE